MTNDRRENKRFDNIKAYFIFENKKYQVVNISSTGLLVECKEGFDEKLVTRWRSGSFEFKLLDIVNNSDLYFKGKAVRFFHDESSERVTKMGVSFTPVGRRPDTCRNIAVGGGKGGVGKSIVSINLALTLSQTCQKKVIILDGDFGNANCHTLLGITRLEKSIEDYFSSGLALEEVITPSRYPGLFLIGGASNKIDRHLDKSEEKTRLIEDIKKLEALYLILDLGAGVGDNTLDLFNIADTRIVVMTPQYTSLQNAYSFVKSAFFRELESRKELMPPLWDAKQNPEKIFDAVQQLCMDHPLRADFERFRKRQRFKIIANMITEEKDISVIKNFQNVVREFLGVESTICGGFTQDMVVKNSVNKMAPFVIESAGNVNVREMNKVAQHIEMMK
ncbi:MAG: P-loop NTPase [Oligoflexales bacterium]|nr:P-loop NTPase [Oligoflexales bacterium]